MRIRCRTLPGSRNIPTARNGKSAARLAYTGAGLGGYSRPVFKPCVLTRSVAVAAWFAPRVTVDGETVQPGRLPELGWTEQERLRVSVNMLLDVIVRPNTAEAPEETVWVVLGSAVNVNGGGGGTNIFSKSALTFTRSWFIVTEQVGVVPHALAAPDHPLKVEELSGTAVRVTMVFGG